MMGAQASDEQMSKIRPHRAGQKQEGAETAGGRGPHRSSGELAEGHYIQPTMFKGHNKMRIFQEEIFAGAGVTTFSDEAEAIEIANDTSMAWAPACGRVTAAALSPVVYHQGRSAVDNCYHAYPAHAAFGGYKQSGIGRENHKMMFDHYRRPRTCW